MKIIYNIFVVLAFVGCSSTPTVQEVVGPEPIKPVNTETTSIETKQVAAEQKADFVTEVRFSKTKHTLTSEQKRKISRIFTKALKSSTIEEVKIISWADRELPSEEDKKLSSDQIAVAEKRNETIEDYVKSVHKNVKVKTYSMAQRTSALKEFIGSSEARIQESLSSAGRSQASKSIVMIITQ